MPTPSRNPKHKPPAAQAAPTPTLSPGRRPDWIIAGILAAAAVVVYLNTIAGDFVYDDARQIVGNTLIQDPQRFRQALFSDVWAFKGSADGSRVSNYWRPSFVLWLIANVRLFGLTSTVGWHLGNIALHALTTVLAFGLLRRLGMTAGIAGAIGLIFAVHPGHAESVAWISGSPDLILAPALLGSLWCVLGIARRPSSIPHWLGAIGLYLVAQGAKEVAIFYPVIVVLAVRASSPSALAEGVAENCRPQGPRPGEGRPALGVPSAVQSLRLAVVFALLAVVYLTTRAMVLGPSKLAAEGSVEATIDLLSAPQVAAFYLRQIVFPLRLGPSYPLRWVSPHNLTFTNFTLPAIICIAAGLWMLWQAWRHRLAALGLALFALPLAPAMHVIAFMPEHIVHDRYLYLPLLGFLMMVVPAIARAIPADLASRLRPSAPWPALAAAAAVCIPLTIQTLRYNTAWLSEVALWRWAIKTDPTSASNLTQLAVQLREQAKRPGAPPDPGAMQDARVAADKAVAISREPWWPQKDHPERVRPELPNALLIRADLALDAGQWAQAEKDLSEVLAVYGAGVRSDEVFKTYERLGLCYDRMGRPAQAEAILRQGRERLPHKWCALTQMLVVVLYGQKRFPEVLAELENARPRVATEPSPESWLVLYRLGQMYEGLGRREDAVAVYREFLERSSGSVSPLLSAPREEVGKKVAK